MRKQFVFILMAMLIPVLLIAGCTQSQLASVQSPQLTTPIPVTLQTSAQESGIVKTDAGLISGINQNGLWIYRGIPFSAPPTGVLRWKPPAPVKPWDGIKEAKVFSAEPPQPVTRSYVPNMSEDCLYLNVWTPALSLIHI